MDNTTTEKIIQELKGAFVDILKESVVRVKFLKLNGEEREMECTLSEKYLPVVTEEKVSKPRSNEALSVWDINANGWRSFRWDRLQAFNIVN